VGDTAAAAQRVEELAATAGTGGSRLIWAMLAGSHGALLLARGDAPGALPLLREAAEAYQQLGCPYETAQVRVLLGEAARQADDDETAQLEFDAAWRRSTVWGRDRTPTGCAGPPAAPTTVARTG